jgi:hypothetical protein
MNQQTIEMLEKANRNLDHVRKLAAEIEEWHIERWVGYVANTLNMTVDRGNLWSRLIEINGFAEGMIRVLDLAHQTKGVEHE